MYAQRQPCAGRYPEEAEKDERWVEDERVSTFATRYERGQAEGDCSSKKRADERDHRTKQADEQTSQPNEGDRAYSHLRTIDRSSRLAEPLALPPLAFVQDRRIYFSRR